MSVCVSLCLCVCVCVWWWRGGGGRETWGRRIVEMASHLHVELLSRWHHAFEEILGPSINLLASDHT